MKKLGKFTITSLLVSVLSIGLVYLLTDIAGLWYMYSAIIVPIALTAMSFATNYLWTWRIKQKELKFVITSRFIKYIITGGSVALITWALLYIFTEFVHLWYIISLSLCWIIGMIIAFLSNNYWTYKRV